MSEMEMKSRVEACELAGEMVAEMVKNEKLRKALERIVKKYKANDYAFLMALGGFMGTEAKYELETLQVKY